MISASKDARLLKYKGAFIGSLCAALLAFVVAGFSFILNGKIQEVRGLLSDADEQIAESDNEIKRVRTLLSNSLENNLHVVTANIGLLKALQGSGDDQIKSANFRELIFPQVDEDDDFVMLTASRPKDITEMFGEAFGQTFFTKESIQKLNKAMENTKNQIKDFVTQIEVLNTAMKSAQERMDEFDDLRQQAVEHLPVLIQLKDELTEAKKSIAVTE